MRIEVLTLFPEMFPGPLGTSIIGRAIKRKLFEFRAIDLRDFTHDAHKTVDDKPYGGGPGMLMKVEVLAEAVNALRRPETRVILTSPRGKRFDQKMAREFSTQQHLLLIAGHYEGVDQRVIETLVDQEVSLGDFVLTSGNLAAMVMTDAIVRLLPGALGCDQSSEDESHSGHLLEYGQYTRPPVFGGRTVPEILQSGDHARIAAWRRDEAERLTRERRPDLWLEYLKAMEAENDDSR